MTLGSPSPWVLEGLAKLGAGAPGIQIPREYGGPWLSQTSHSRAFALVVFRHQMMIVIEETRSHFKRSFQPIPR